MNSDQCEKFSSLWLEIENYFNQSLAVPVVTEVLTDLVLEGHYAYVKLGWRRAYGGMRWCIYAGLADDKPPKEYVWKPILECALEVRIGLATQIGKLEVELQKQRMLLEGRLKKATKALEAFVLKRCLSV